MKPVAETAAPGIERAPCRVLIVDDHPLFRRGIAALIAEEKDFALCCEAESVETGLDAVRRLKPDVALVDVSLPGANGIELVKAIIAEQPRFGVLVISMHDETIYAIRALRAGAKGYMLKTEAMANLMSALRKVAAGEVYVSPHFKARLAFMGLGDSGSTAVSPLDKLSAREREVFELFGRGFGTNEVADELKLSVKTIETHRMHINAKLGFSDSRDMVRAARDWVTQQQC